MQTKISQISLQHLDQHVCMCKCSCCVIIRIFIVLSDTHPKRDKRKLYLIAIRWSGFLHSAKFRYFIGMLSFTEIRGIIKHLNSSIFFARHEIGKINQIGLKKKFGGTIRFTNVQDV